MATTIHAKRPAAFPKQCVRCLSEQAEMRKFTDTAHGGVVTVTATLEIPVCDQCWRAPRPWWIAGGILLVLFLASGIPFAIAQDKHADIPKIVHIAMLLLMVGFVICFFVARKRAPVRLVPTKIDSENVRIKFFNQDYANRFVEANKETTKVISPWKYG